MQQRFLLQILLLYSLQGYNSGRKILENSVPHSKDFERAADGRLTV